MKKIINFFKQKNVIVWVINFTISFALLFVGYKVTRNKFINLNGESSAQEATVLEVLDKSEESYEVDGEKQITYNITFKAKLKGGKEITATQTIDNFSSTSKEVQKNDRIFVYEVNDEYNFGDYVRINKIIILAIIFFTLIIVLGGIKGVNTLISLLFTCLAVFMFFVPSVLKGMNIYLTAIITCIYVIIMTLVFINGISKKTLTTILGCSFGVILAGLIFIIMDQFLFLTGVTCEEELYLQMLDVKIDLRGIIFAAITISSMGAVMDVSMDISSSLFEIKKHKPDITFKEIFKSGLNIGRDIMGTMANTLVLAFIGKSLSTTLLILTYSSSLGEVFNKELVIVELLEGLIGSTSILLTAPITSLVCSYVYTKKKAN